MAQLDFILNKEEQVEFMQFAISIGCKIIPDMHYNSANYLTIETIDGFLRYFGGGKFFLINEIYSLFPLEMRWFEKEGERKFYITQRYGGPAIDFYSSSLIESTESRVGTGFIAFYSSYYTGSTTIAAPADLKLIYKLFSSFIKGRSKKISLAKRSYWVSNRVIELVQNGELSLMSSGGDDMIKIIRSLK